MASSADDDPPVLRASDRARTWSGAGDGDGASTLSIPADDEPRWLESASLQLQSSIASLDANKAETSRLQDESTALALKLRQEQEKLQEALEDLEVVQGERDELEEAVFEVQTLEEDEREELQDTRAALAESRAEVHTLKAELAALRATLAERDAALQRVVTSNSDLLRDKAEQDAELQRALEMNLTLVYRIAEIDAIKTQPPTPLMTPRGERDDD